MSDDKIPEVVSTGDMEVLGTKITVHVLDDGRRVIEQSDMRRLLSLLHNAFASVDDDEDDDFDICEVCEKKLRTGDLVHACPDGPIFCEDHAPTWNDIRHEYDHAKASGEFVDLFDEPEDAALSDSVVDGRIAAGEGDKKHVWPR